MSLRISIFKSHILLVLLDIVVAWKGTPLLFDAADDTIARKLMGGHQHGRITPSCVIHEAWLVQHEKK
jgi:hypothetical protein